MFSEKDREDLKTVWKQQKRLCPTDTAFLI